MAGARTIIYVAATTAAAESGADALGDAADGIAVEPVTTPEGVRRHVDDADCVVFAETPTTTEGATVLDVIEAADGTPLVLFCESSFDPEMARSTDGVSGYVRRDTPDAVAHLVDEIAWHCPAAAGSAGATGGAEADRHRRAAETLARDYAAASADRERLRETVRHLRTAAAHLETDRERAATERDRLRRAFRAYPEPACAFAVGPEATPTVRAVTDAFRDRFGLDPDDAVGASVADAFDAAGISVDAARFRDALDPERAENDWITGESAIEGVESESAPEAALENADTAAIGAADGPGATDAMAAGAGRETTLDGRVKTADGIRDLTVTVIPPGGPTVDPDASTGLVVCRDGTDRRRDEQELAARDRRLESIGEVLDEELREPLNVARGYLEVAEETGDSEHFAEVESAHDALRAATDHLARLVGRDAIVVERESIELHELTRRAWVAVDTGDARLDLGRNGRFRGDPGQLRDVFEHLISVATEGAESDAGAEGDADGGGSVVSVGATDDGFYVAGSAVTDEVDPFAGRTATADGTGLRLGRVESVADAHGWRVGVAESDDGTAFAFRGVDVDDAA